LAENPAFDPAEVIAAWAGDPVAFARGALGVAEFDDWQLEALAALASDDKLAIRSGHGVGKTAFLAWTVIWWLLTHYPAKAACTANTQSQLQDVLWAEIANWARKLPAGFRELILVKADKVELASPGKAENAAFARTAAKDRPEALQGFHSANMLFIVDEASGVPDIIFEVAEGALSTEGAKVILTGNPTRTTGYFYDAFFGPLAHRWWRRRVSCEESKRVSRKFIEDMRTKYGEDSNVYRVRVLGEFPRQDEDTVVPLDLAESAVGRDVMPLGNIVWGLDVARFGSDRSVLIKRQGGVVLDKPRTWRQLDLMQLCGAIVNEYKACPFDRKPAEVLVDSIGLGAGVVDRLREMNFGPVVRGINVSEASAMSERFVRLRDELWWSIREWLETREARLPKDDDLLGELCAPRYAYTSSGKIKVESKDDMRKRGVQSPDLADALMLTFGSSGIAAHFGSKWGSRRLTPNTGWVV
jgi:hypothetical protein